MKRLLSVLLVMIAVLLPTKSWAADGVSEPYAVLSADSLTVTFYYDDQKQARGGMDITNYYRSTPSPYAIATTAVIDASFANYQPTSTAYWFAMCSSLTSITGMENINTADVTDMGNMFRECRSLTSLDVSHFNTQNVKSMTLMFYECSGLTSLDVTQFDTQNVTDMVYMFGGCSGLTSIDVSKFNTAKVASMAYMFSYCSSLTSLDVSHFNTEEMTGMGGMFRDCSGLTSLDVSSFNTANVTDMSSMFHGCTGLTSLDLSNFNTANVTYMDYMFGGCSSLTTIYAGSGWSTAAVTRGLDAFINCSNLKGGAGTTYDYNHIDHTYAHIDGGTANPGYFTDKNASPAVVEPYAVLSADGLTVTFYYDGQRTVRGGVDINFNYSLDTPPSYATATTAVIDASFAGYRPISTANWFMNCRALTSITGMENLKTDDVTNMSSMFMYCSSLQNVDLSGFNTSNVTQMFYMFDECSSLTSLDLSNFNTSNVTTMYAMFRYCSNLSNLNISSFDTSNANTIQEMFNGCSSLTSLDLGHFNTSKVTTMRALFYGCSGLTSLNLANFNTQNVTEMDEMFERCSGLTSLNLTNFNTQNVSEMDRMFDGCTGLTSLDLSSFNTENVTDMSGMFDGCSSLTSLDLTRFNTQKVTNMSGMFDGCSSLTSLDLSNFNTQNVIYMGQMFQGCHQLKELNISNFNTSNVTSLFQTFVDCSSLEQLDLSSFNTQNVTTMSSMFFGCSSLKNINVSSFNTEKVTDMMQLFYYCPALTSVDLSNFRTDSLTTMWGMFRYCFNLVDVNLSNFNTSKVTSNGSMFEGCSSLATIQAGSAAIPDSIYAQVGNPNLLVYVNEAALAPSGVQNVVVNGQAREIVLTDATTGNNNFYVPQTFTAERISYTRNFTQSTQVGMSRGWESIALPFDVQTITHETKGTIAPFGNTASNRHFWLRELGSNGLQSATGIAANTPYVISMPNSSDYTDSYNLAGRVTFAAENTQVPVTEVKATAMADESIVMMPTMQRQDRSSEVWALNVGEVRGRYLEGSVFERDYREVRPFEAFTVHREENSQPAPRYVPLQEIGGTTGIHSVESGELSTEKWYDLNGRQLQGKPSAKGVYINNGQKIVIR